MNEMIKTAIALVGSQKNLVLPAGYLNRLFINGSTTRRKFHLNT